MSAGDYENGLNAFFQAFKSYDEAGDQSRLRCLKYLVLATMLHASSINPFDSQEARPYRDDPEIMVMTNLVSAFQSNEIHKFERILRQNQSRIMDDEFIREHVEDLLRTIRLQVLRRVIRPYTRISLAAISVALNDVSVTIVENLLVSLIMDGSLDGSIDLTQGVLVKRAERGSGAASGGGGAGGDASSAVPFGSSGGGGGGDGRSKTDDPILMQLDAMNQLVGMLDDLSTQITSNRGLPEPKSNAAGGGSRGMLVH
jgi:PCI domain